MDASEELTAVNVCRGVGLFHVHGVEEKLKRGWGGCGEDGFREAVLGGQQGKKLF